MSCHFWGDTDFDWESLYKAESILEKWMRVGRIGFHIKEKFGELRATTYFWDGSLHSLIYPGYCYNQFPNWLWKLDNNYIRNYMPKCIISIVHSIQKKIYAYAYNKVNKLFPHIFEEICSCADYYELIDGGKELHDRVWVKY